MGTSTITAPRIHISAAEMTSDDSIMGSNRPHIQLFMKQEVRCSEALLISSK